MRVCVCVCVCVCEGERMRGLGRDRHTASGVWKILFFLDTHTHTTPTYSHAHTPLPPLPSLPIPPTHTLPTLTCHFLLALKDFSCEVSNRAIGHGDTEPAATPPRVWREYNNDVIKMMQWVTTFKAGLIPRPQTISASGMGMRLAMKIKFGIDQWLVIIGKWGLLTEIQMCCRAWVALMRYLEREEMTNALSHLQVVHSDSGMGVGNGTNQYLALFPDW